MTDKGFRCLVAPFEADAQLTFLMAMKKISAVIIEDSDLFVYGCDTIVFKLTIKLVKAFKRKTKTLSKSLGSKTGLTNGSYACVSFMDVTT